MHTSQKVSSFYYCNVLFYLAPVSPPTTDWLWSNATHIYIQLSGWDDGGCDVTKWDVDYRPISSNIWMKAENKAVSYF